MFIYSTAIEIASILIKASGFFRIECCTKRLGNMDRRYLLSVWYGEPVEGSTLVARASTSTSTRWGRRAAVLLYIAPILAVTGSSRINRC
jgi:hypothetical protein